MSQEVTGTPKDVIEQELSPNSGFSMEMNAEQAEAYADALVRKAQAEARKAEAEAKSAEDLGKAAAESAEKLGGKAEAVVDKMSSIVEDASARVGNAVAHTSELSAEVVAEVKAGLKVGKIGLAVVAAGATAYLGLAAYNQFQESRLTGARLDQLLNDHLAKQ